MVEGVITFDTIQLLLVVIPIVALATAFYIRLHMRVNNLEQHPLLVGYRDAENRRARDAVEEVLSRGWETGALGTFRGSSQD